jgi:hypothetical protein
MSLFRSADVPTADDIRRFVVTIPDIIKGSYAGLSAISIGTIHTALAHIKKYCEVTFARFEVSHQAAHLMGMYNPNASLRP